MARAEAAGSAGGRTVFNFGSAGSAERMVMGGAGSAGRLVRSGGQTNAGKESQATEQRDDSLKESALLRRFD